MSSHDQLNTPERQEKGIRIAKFLAGAGLCSRRHAEVLISEGRVSVNGIALDTPAFKVLPSDDVRFDEMRVQNQQPTRLWRYHKPDGLVTTHKDPQERTTVFETIPETMPRVISVGRLDITTEGLLLLTTDGTLARSLEMPSTGWIRRYRVRAYGRVTQNKLDKLQDGVRFEGVEYGPIKAVLDSQQGGNSWMTMSIAEGKNREIRQICRYLDLHTNRLIRTSYGPFQLGKLNKGAFEEIPGKQLKEQLGKKLSEGLNFQ